MPRYDIFISHKSQDKLFLRALENFLDTNGYSYWSDSKMEEGEAWTNQIQRAISNSKIMIILLSQNVLNDSYNIESEITYAVEKRLKFIVIKLDDSRMEDYSGVFALYLKVTQWISASDDITKTFHVVDKAIKMNLATNNAEKRSLSDSFIMENKELEEEKLEKLMMERMYLMTLKKIESLIINHKFATAMQEIESQLLLEKNPKIFELKIRCLSKDYTVFPDNLMDIVKQMEYYGASKEEVSDVKLKITSGIKNSKQKQIQVKKKTEEQYEEKRVEEKNEKLKVIKQSELALERAIKQHSIKNIVQCIKASISIVVSFFICSTICNNIGIGFLFSVGFFLAVLCYYTTGRFLRFLLAIASAAIIAGSVNSLLSYSGYLSNPIYLNLYKIAGVETTSILLSSFFVLLSVLAYISIPKVRRVNKPFKAFIISIIGVIITALINWFIIKTSVNYVVNSSNQISIRTMFLVEYGVLFFINIFVSINGRRMEKIRFDKKSYKLFLFRQNATIQQLKRER